MNPRHRPSRAAIELVARFEGYRRKAARLPDGRWTVGYGHTKSAREGVTVSKEDAEALLTYDLLTVAERVSELAYTPLTQNEFDALCAFAFGIGIENFRASGVLRRLNEGAHLQAACAMELWRRAQFEGQSIVIDALIRRRAAEKALFLTPDHEEWVPVPTAVLPPDLDYDGQGSVPRETPAAVTTPLDGERAKAERGEGPGPAQAAAASVTAKLRRLFQPDTPTPAPLNLQAEDRPLVVLPPEDEEEQAKLEPAVEPEPEPAPKPEPDVVEPVAVETGGSTIADRLDPAPLEDDAAPAQQPGLGILAALAGGGVLLFITSLAWYFSVSSASGSNAVTLFAVWTACLAGVAAFVVAVYLMLERLAHAVGDLAEDLDS